MILAASVFLIGSIINGAAENVWMLIGGRMFHGIGIGFVIQVAPMPLGFGNKASVFSTVHSAIVMSLMQIILMYLDHNGWSGRRFKLLVGGALMIISHIAIGVDLKFGFSGQASQSIVYKIILAVLMCIHTAGFTWSWGLPGWLVERDISIRNPVRRCNHQCLCQPFHGLCCSTCFPSWPLPPQVLPILHLCWCTCCLDIVLIYLFVPKTKDIPIEQVSNFWKEHWYWSRFFSNEEGQTA
ncbi:hypothetical protein AAC387_Pa04g1539 [Persea americana]